MNEIIKIVRDKNDVKIIDYAFNYAKATKYKTMFYLNKEKDGLMIDFKESKVNYPLIAFVLNFKDVLNPIHFENGFIAGDPQEVAHSLISLSQYINSKDLTFLNPKIQEAIQLLLLDMIDIKEIFNKKLKISTKKK